MGLWTGLFVLSTLLVNAPTIPALLRFTRLNQASCGVGWHGVARGVALRRAAGPVARCMRASAQYCTVLHSTALQQVVPSPFVHTTEQLPPSH